MYYQPLNILRSLLLFLSFLNLATAQWTDILQKVLNVNRPTSTDSNQPIKFTATPGSESQIWNITQTNWKSVLGDSTVDWLVYFSDGVEGGGEYDKVSIVMIMNLRDW